MLIWKNHRLKEWLVFSMMLLAIWSACFYEIERNRKEHIRNAEVATLIGAQAFAENTVSTFKRLDELLINLRTFWTGDHARFSSLVKTRETSINDIAFQVSIIDPEGYLAFSNLFPSKERLYLADSEQFRFHRESNDDRLFISKPYKGKLTGKWTLQLTRPIYVQGVFKGVIGVSVNPETLVQYRNNLKLSNDGVLAIVRNTGEIMARSPITDDGYGALIKDSYFLPEAPISGNFYRPSKVDGITRLYGFYTQKSYPVTFVVAENMEFLLKSHQEHRYTVFVFAGTLSLFLFGFLLLLNRFSMRAEKSQAEINQGVAFTDSVIATMDDGIAVCHSISEPPGIKFTVWNPSMQLLTGYTLEEINQLGWYQTVYSNPEIQERARLRMERMRLGDNLRREEWTISRKNGESRTVEISTMIVPQSSNQPAVLAVFRDISDRKHAEKELEEHRHQLEKLVERRTHELAQTEAKAMMLLESSADGLYGVDLDGRVTFVNPAACASLGYTAEQILGQTGHELFHHSRPDGSPYPREECVGHRAALSGQEIRVEDEVYWHADGHPIPVMYAVHPTFQNGEITGAVISFVDITAQRAAAAARETALLAAEDLARVRSEFLANMSHEIRTPLNGVIGFAEIGHRHYQNAEKARESFEKIKSSGKRLLGVINDILDFSKIEAGKLSIEKTEVNLLDVINHTIEIISDRVEAKRLQLHLSLADNLPETCLSDPLRLGQILINLLSNAVKFTEHGSVTLDVKLAGKEFVFRVSDTGIGISEAQLKALFNPFQQADGSHTRRFGGTGLGLAISKRIVELMQGSIRVESQVGTGSTFEFRLPYSRVGEHQKTAENQTTAISPGAKPLSGIRVLIAEDEAINQMVLVENLVDFGATTRIANNGQEVLDILSKAGADAFDIVLMDIQMPEMDGYEATRRLLEMAPKLPVIGQTAHALVEERDKCLATGMVAHIAKPLQFDELLKIILAHARRSASSGSGRTSDPH